ncbi:MAG: hypothetical protein IPO18_06075 [bacterium]|nr:hypothetical protein [bacterium]
MTDQPLRFNDLSQNWQWLTKVMMRVQDGELRNLTFTDVEPDISSDTRTLCKIRVDRDGGGRPEFVVDDFVLPLDLLRFIDWVQTLDGHPIKRVVVKNGYPHLIEVEDLV